MQVLANRGDDRTQSFLGTRGYLAPEMLQRNSYDKSIDIWVHINGMFFLLSACSLTRPRTFIGSRCDNFCTSLRLLAFR